MASSETSDNLWWLDVSELMFKSLTLCKYWMTCCGEFQWKWKEQGACYPWQWEHTASPSSYLIWCINTQMDFIYKHSPSRMFHFGSEKTDLLPGEMLVAPPHWETLLLCCRNTFWQLHSTANGDLQRYNGVCVNMALDYIDTYVVPLVKFVFGWCHSCCFLFYTLANASHSSGVKPQKEQWLHSL